MRSKFKPVRWIDIVLMDDGYAIRMPLIGIVADKIPQAMMAIREAERLQDIQNTAAAGQVEWLVNPSDEVALAAGFVRG